MSTSTASTSGRFWFHIAHLMTGSGLAQAINIGIYPVLTRIYRPEDFGLMALITSLAVPLSVATAWGYEPALVLPREHHRARTLLSMLLFLTLANGLLLFVLLIPLRTVSAALLNTPSFAHLALWVAPATAVVCWNRVYEFWLVRRRSFSSLAGSRVLGAGAGAATKVAWGLGVGVSVAGLVLGFLVCEIGKALYVLLRTGKEMLPRRFPLGESRSLLREYSNLPRFDVPYQLLRTFGLYVPVLVFSAFFGSRMVGFYILGMRMVLLPVELTIHSVTQVFYERSVAENRDQGDLAGLVERTTAQLALLGFAPFCAVVITGQWLFGWIFGAQWVRAGLYAQILAPALYLQFISAPLALFNTLGKQKKGLLWQIGFFAMTALGLVVGAAVRNEIMAVSLISLAFSIGFLQLMHLNFGLCGARLKNVGREIRSAARSLLVRMR